MMDGNLEVTGNIKLTKINSFKLRVVLTEENEDQNDISFLDDTDRLI